ncbi:MAG TPA: diacylglycerol kinase family protein [Kiloniellales bacterium]|nr:diacylglycerol kinase family protein [Kiloniellales bacterium]
MFKIGLISNPRSQQNKRGMPRLQAAADTIPGILHHRLGDVAEISDVLKEFARKEVSIVAVAGGDGTTQATMTHLLEERPYGEEQPLLALLPRGMTNMTAADVGLRGKPEKVLRRLNKLSKRDDLSRYLRRRPILRLEGMADAPPQRGMFFGAAAIYKAIEICRERVHALGIEADWAAAFTIGGLLLGWATGKERDSFPGEMIGTALDGGEEVMRRELLVLVTTLDRLVVGSRPFWNQGTAPLRCTAIAHPPERLLWNARRVLYGPRERSLPQGYRSCSAHRIDLRLQGPFTLDGQFYHPSPDRPLEITADDSLTFLRF